MSIIFAMTIIKDVVVTTTGFKDPKPVGDVFTVLNSVENVDTVMILDIRATQENRVIDSGLVRKVVSEFGISPIVGGGIASYKDFESVLSSGASGVVLNSVAIPKHVEEAVDSFGRDTVVAAVDVRRYHGVITSRIKSGTTGHPNRVDARGLVHDLSLAGVVSILLTSIDYDGGQCGYDLDTLCDILPYTKAKIIINGGASCEDDMLSAFHYGASSFAARSMFLGGIK